MLFICAIVWGQTVDNMTEIRLQPGENTTWHPFDSCKELHFSTMGSSVANVQPKPDGRVVITALTCGTAYVRAKCGEMSENVRIVVTEIKPEKTVVNYKRPATKPFYGHYVYNPPTDHFFISYSLQQDGLMETRAKIGDEESYNDGVGIDRYWNVKTGECFYYHSDKGWKPDVKFDFEPLSPSFFPLNAFFKEVSADSISDCFIGEEYFLGINCWVFFTQNPDGGIAKFWVDPANGCTLKCQSNYDEPYSVKVYDLDYRRWDFGPRRKKSHKDVTR